MIIRYNRTQLRLSERFNNNKVSTASIVGRVIGKTAYQADVGLGDI
jgi:hypothetical protein